MSVCTHPDDTDLAAELSRAEEASSTGDWRHALHHYVGALGRDPFDARAHDALRRLCVEHDVVAALEGNTFFGAHLARAMVLADRGDFDTAFSIVTQVDQVRPDLGAVRLLLAWCERTTPSRSAIHRVLQRLSEVTVPGTGRVRFMRGECAAVAPYAALAERIVRFTSEPGVTELLAGLLRRAGRYDDAIRAVEAGPDALDPASLVQVGLAHRGAGRADRAVEVFEHLVTLTGERVHRIELARALADARRFADAAGLLRRVRAEGDAALGAESELFQTWLDGCTRGEPEALARDYDLVRRLALGHGATVAVNDVSTRWLWETGAPRGEPVELRVSELEAPSVRLCLALHQGTENNVRAVRYRFEAVPTPDPRKPMCAVSTLLWREVDGVMVQAVPQPPLDVMEMVANVAWAGDYFAVWDAAGERATRAPLPIEHVAHAMVYHYDPPENIPVLVWVARCQLAAACLLARAAPVWTSSPARPVLLDLLRGPRDWTTAAVVLALGELAARDADALPEVRRELIALAEGAFASSYCCYGWALTAAARKVPMFPPNLAQRLEQEWPVPLRS